MSGIVKGGGVTTESFDPDAAAAPGAGIFGLPFAPADSRVVVLPVPFEATTSYGGGTSGGPEAIFDASKQVDLFDAETGRPYEDGIAMWRLSKRIARWNRDARKHALPIIKAGGAGSKKSLRDKLERVNEISEWMNEWVESHTRDLLMKGKFVAVLGGDHSVPFGAIKAQADRHSGIGILHLDAHADLREAYEGFTWSHASIFHNVMTRIEGVTRLVQVGVRDLGNAERKMIDDSNGRIVTFYDAGLAEEKERGTPWSQVADRIVAELPELIYLSWDIDGLDPTLCPNTGTPVPGGLSWNEAIGLLRALVRSGKKVIGLDLCEVSPGDSEWDANVGARLLYKMIGFALKTHEARDTPVPPPPGGLSPTSRRSLS